MVNKKRLVCAAAVLAVTSAAAAQAAEWRAWNIHKEG